MNHLTTNPKYYFRLAVKITKSRRKLNFSRQEGKEFLENDLTL